MGQRRHWKQRFRKDAEFIWTRAILCEGKQYQRGDLVTSERVLKRAKRFWDTGHIELANWNLEGKSAEKPPEVKPKKTNGKKKKRANGKPKKKRR